MYLSQSIVTPCYTFMQHVQHINPKQCWHCLHPILVCAFTEPKKNLFFSGFPKLWISIDHHWSIGDFPNHWLGKSKSCSPARICHRRTNCCPSALDLHRWISTCSPHDKLDGDETHLWKWIKMATWCINGGFMVVFHECSIKFCNFCLHPSLMDEHGGCP